MQTTIVEVHQLLRSSGWRLAVAESLTGGRIQSLMTSVSGASDVFSGGVTTYTIDRKVALLKVDKQVVTACNAVSEAVARQMVAGVCDLFESECGVATTGYAETNAEVETPFAWVAVSIDGDAVVKRVEAEGTRLEVQDAIAQQAMEMLRAALAKRV